ncbi:unnamed protein product [Pedinophyceae sp. YPF-701]|nr:unnamed protein product [Pedinophyceae sp. YPF-701]
MGRWSNFVESGARPGDEDAEYRPTRKLREQRKDAGGGSHALNGREIGAILALSGAVAAGWAARRTWPKVGAWFGSRRDAKQTPAQMAAAAAERRAAGEATPAPPASGDGSSKKKKSRNKKKSGKKR